MLRTPIYILSLFLFSFLSGVAQEKSFKIGKVSPEELELDTCWENDADAMFLAKTTNFSVRILRNKVSTIYKNFTRIKLFRKSSFDHADREIMYYHGDGTENVVRLKAIITYPDGTTYQLKRKEFFKETIDDKWTRIKFTFPNVQVGAILDFQYDLISNNYINLEDFYFQYELPVEYAELSFIIPENIEYIFLKRGLEYIKTGNDKYYMHKIPSMKKESHITTMNDYRGRIKMQIKGYRDGYGIFKPLLPTWEKIIEDLYKNKMFGHQFQKQYASNRIIKEAEHIINSENDLKTKILNLQNFLLDNVTWNGYYSIFSTEGIETAFKNKEANATELNFMMMSLLSELEIEIYPVLVSTRNHGKLFTAYPFIDQFSYSLVYAVVEGEPMLIDISEKFRAPGDVRYNGLNGEGLLAIEGNPQWIPIPAAPGSDIFFGNFKIEEGSLVGEMQGKYKSYNAIPERESFFEDKSGKHWKNRLSSKFPDAEVISASYSNMDNLYDDFKDKIEIKIPGACNDIGDIYYINPFIYSNYDENIFKLNDRNFPVDFGYPVSEQYIFMLDIPDGFEVEELPEAVSITNEDGSAIFKISCSTMKGKIQLVRKLEIKKTVFLPSEYVALKKLFDLMLEKNGEQIVLKKI